MRIALAIVAVKALKALLDRRARGIGRAQAPFTKGACHVARCLEDFGDGHNAVCERPLAREDATIARIAIVTNLCVRQMLPCQQHTPGRSTDGRPRVVLSEPHPGGCQSINVGCADFFLAIATQFAIA